MFVTSGLSFSTLFAFTDEKQRTLWPYLMRSHEMDENWAPISWRGKKVTANRNIIIKVNNKIILF